MTEIRTVKMSDLNKGPVIHQAIPDDFIERVKNFKQVLSEVETSTMEEALDNFQRDADPEKELFLWEHIAKIYQWTIDANTGLTPEQKKEVFALLLSLSMAMEDFDNIKTLTRETVDEIVNRYQHE